MFLRPTSGSDVHHVLAVDQVTADLPLKTFQIVNTFRYETKQTRSFIRVWEIHPRAHRTCRPVGRRCPDRRGLESSRAPPWPCLPAIICKARLGHLPGLQYTNAVDAIMPNGRTLQIASYHHYRDQWAKAFDITYEDSDGNQQHCHQTTFGMSERLLGAVVGVHGDDWSHNATIDSADPSRRYARGLTPRRGRGPRRGRRAAAQGSGHQARLDDRDRPASTTTGRSGRPNQGRDRPEDLSNGTFVSTMRTGARRAIRSSTWTAVRKGLDDVSAELRSRSSALLSQDEAAGRTPGRPEGPDDGIVYEVAFDGNDADAEKLEKSTNLTLLKDDLHP